MPLLLTQEDLQPLITGSDFYAELFHVICDALVQRKPDDLGQLSWLAFPFGKDGHRFNVNLLSTPYDGTSVRVFPVSGGAIHPQQDGYFAFLLDEQDGHLLALLATDDLSPLRTAAPVGIACAHLARPASNTLAIIGSGIQARYQLRSISHACPGLQHVRVYSPTADHRQTYAREMSHETGLTIEAVDTATRAIEGADIVCITATGRGPVAEASCFQPGSLVISITGQGLPADLVTRVVVPARQGPTIKASGWDPRPVMSVTGGRDPDTIAATLCDVLRGTAFARAQEQDILLYEQRGSYAWDAALLHWAYRWALGQQVGTIFSLSSRATH